MSLLPIFPNGWLLKAARHSPLPRKRALRLRLMDGSMHTTPRISASPDLQFLLTFGASVTYGIVFFPGEME